VSAARDMPISGMVSVIMIFLDAERFIEDAIASVFAQTWPLWELLLVNDGSSDRSTAIAKGWAERHPERVRYLQHGDGANHGTGPSRNLGLVHASGEYIAFLDADDLFLPERLARHVAMLETRPEVDAVQGEILVWHSWQGMEVAGAPDRMAPDLSFAAGFVLEPPTLLLMLLETEWCTSPGVCNVTLRRRLVATIGGFEDSFRGLHEDDVFFSKV
jgi:glycosyltransferase involved in cell wall biosynthesis